MIIQVTRMPILEVIQLIDDVKQYYQYKSSVHIVIFSGGPEETDAPWSTAWKLAATAKSWIWNNFVQNYPEEPGWLQNYWGAIYNTRTE